MGDDWYQNKAISKDNAEVFAPANRCIYCTDGEPPFTREHVIPRGLGGSMVFPRASCERCRRIILDIETYCLRGPFLSHRLTIGMVNHPEDLGTTIRMPIIVEGQRREREFSIEDYPNFLVLPQFHDPPGLLTGRSNHTGRVSFSIWGVEEQLRALHSEGNAILVENFDLNKFGRTLAKIAHGATVGVCGVDSLEPFLTDYILGKTNVGDVFIGNWGEDGMRRYPGLLHQIGHAFVEANDRVRVDVRLRLFAEYDNTPVYRIIVGLLTKPLDDVLASRGLRQA
jgi:hypothetical protein